MSALASPVKGNSHWRRWWFLVTLLANLLFMLYAAGGVRVVYATTPAAHANLLGALVGIFFWAGMVSATLTSGALALGLLRTHYHLLLLTVLGGACYCGGYLGLATTIITLRMGAGFLEPLSLWQLLAAQILIIWSARTHTPPPPLIAPRLLAQRAQHLLALRPIARLWRAARAFSDTLTTKE